ncbi:MAG: hypothetical protein HZA46_10145 [Planctomycetales bacterium]|nr:hypothetical protein [Planctomycetales bacterium]
MSNSLKVLGLIGGSVLLLVNSSCEPRKPAKVVTVAKVDQPALHQPPVSVPTAEKPIATPTDTVESKLEQALLQKTQFEFSEVPLNEAVRRLAEQHKLPFRIDEQKLLDEGVQVEQPMTMSVSDITLRSALNLLLKPLQLTYVIKAESIVITTATDATDHLETRIYDVEKLVRYPEETQPDFQSLIDLITATVQPDSWDTAGGEASMPQLPPSFLVIRQTQAVHAVIDELLRDLEHVLSVPDEQAPAMATESPSHAAERTIREKLRQPASLRAAEKPLHMVIADLSKATGTPFWIDFAKLTDEGVTLDQPISFQVSNVRLESMLDLLLRPLQLAWLIEDEVLKITTLTDTTDKLFTRVYDVRDLAKYALVSLPKKSPLNIYVGGASRPTGGHGSDGGGAPRPTGGNAGGGGGFFQVRELHQFGAAGGGESGGGSGGEFRGPDDRGVLDGSTVEIFDGLMQAIHSGLAPDSWNSVGGEGTMSEFRGLLVVRQTYPNHLELERLLVELRNKHRRHTAIVGRHQPSSPDDLLFVIYDVGDHPADELARRLPEFVAPKTWQSAKGNGQIYATKGRLFVRQTRRVHRQLLAVLDRVVERGAPQR